MPDTSAPTYLGTDRVVDLAALTELSDTERTELARSLADGPRDPLQDLARQLLDTWDELDPVQRTAGLTVLAVALSWSGDRLS